MKRILHTPSLRFTLAFVVAGLLATLLVFDKGYDLVVRQPERIETSQSQAARQVLDRLQQVMNAEYIHGDLVSAEKALTIQGTDPGINALAAIDEHGRVMVATRFAWKNQPLAGVTNKFQVAVLEDVLKFHRTVVSTDALGESVIAYAPLLLPPGEGELRSTRTGLLFLDYDLATAKRNAWREAFAPENWLRWLVAVSLSAIFIVLLLNLWIIRPLHRLKLATQSLAKGESGVETGLAGTGEIAELGQHFDSMSQEISASRRALVRANKELEKKVTERTEHLEQAKEDLEQARDRAEQTSLFLAESQRVAHLGSWEWDIESGALAWSDEVFRIFGYEPQTFSPTYEAFLRGIHPDDREQVTSAVAKSLESNGNPYMTEHRVIQPDGTERTVHEQGEVFRNEEGKPCRMIGTVHDITERVRMEALVTQSEKMQSVGGLAAGMAHELNNPLAGILQSIQNVRRRLSPELKKNKEVAQALDFDLEKAWEYFERREISNFLQQMSEAGERAATIVQNMLEFARQSDEELIPEELDRLVDSTLELAAVDYELKQKYGFREIEIVREYERSISPVPCYASDIQQVLLSLLRNAAQALGERKDANEPPRITVRILDTSDMVCVEVEDNGPGMDRSTQRRAFEPFFTTRIVGEGAGLGLSIAYFIITQVHKGNMSVESQPGHGARFSFCLPMKTG